MNGVIAKIADSRYCYGMIICVTGSSSNVGKTTLVEKLLKRLSGKWGACKVTLCRPGTDHRCPHGKEESCGVCSENLETFIAEIDEEVLRRKGKDTWRYYQAGAAKVVWVRTRKEYLQKGVDRAVKLFDDTDGIIFEGNNALAALVPDLAVMAVGSPAVFKASARRIVDRIDLTGEASDPAFLETIVRRIVNTGGTAAHAEKSGV